MVDTDGLEYYIVGGAVRDELLGVEPNDKDYVVVGHTVDEMRDRGFEADVGERFPVFLHPETGDEWALARTEEKAESEKGYKSIMPHASPDVTLEEDLSRRDLTINAMAKDPRTGDIIDPYGGRDDLERGVVRHVTEAFAEDPLRVLRAARFAARFGFDVHEDTKEFMRDVAPELDHVANERIYEEMCKALSQARTPRVFFDVLMETDALDVFLPELAELQSIPAGPSEYHQEGDAYEHSMRVLTEMHDLAGNNVRSLLAATFHDIGKIETPDDVLPHHHKHEKRGVEVANRIGNRLEMSNEHRRVMESASRYHMMMGKVEDLREATVIDLVESLRDDYTATEPGSEVTIPHITLTELVDLAEADARGREPAGDFNRELAEATFDKAKTAIDAISGEVVLEEHDIEPGEKVGQVIHQRRVEHLRQNL